jgi:ABC-type Na+ transport system ATPase subunit NatA
MHRGRLLAEGTLEELRDRHAERDLEELFFQLITRMQDEELVVGRQSFSNSG